MIRSGIIILVGWAPGFGAIVWAEANGFNWYAHHPEWLLRAESNAGSRWTRWSVAREVVDRHVRGGLTHEGTQEFLEIALREQRRHVAHPHQARDEWIVRSLWREFADRARTRGEASDEHWIRFAQAITRVRTEMPERAVSGGGMTILSVLSDVSQPYDGSDTNHVRARRVSISGLSVESAEGSLFLPTANPGVPYTEFTERVRVDLPPGEANVYVEYECTLYPSAEEDAAPMATWTIRTSRRLDVLTAGSRRVETVGWAASIEAPQDRIIIHPQLLELDDGRINCHLPVDQQLLPAAIVADVVLLLSEGSELVLGTVEVASLAGYEGYVPLNMWIGPTSEDAVDIHSDGRRYRADVILRPNLEYADTRTVFDQVIGEDIVLYNVPIERDHWLNRARRAAPSGSGEP